LFPKREFFAGLQESEQKKPAFIASTNETIPKGTPISALVSVILNGESWRGRVSDYGERYVFAQQEYFAWFVKVERGIPLNVSDIILLHSCLFLYTKLLDLMISISPHFYDTFFS